MKWFKKKSSNKSQLVSLATLFRWYCYDTGVTEPNKMSSALGLTPLSEDVERMELMGSLQRLQNIEPILPFLKAMAEINSAVLAERQAALISEGVGQHFSEEDQQRLVTHIEELAYMVSLSAVVSSFSAALGMNLLRPEGYRVAEYQVPSMITGTSNE